MIAVGPNGRERFLQEDSNSSEGIGTSAKATPLS